MSRPAEAPKTSMSNPAVDMIPGGISDVAMTRELPVALPKQLRGLEDVVAEQALELAGPDAGKAEFDRAVSVVVKLLLQRIRGYDSLSRIATRSSSLPAQLRAGV